MKKLIVPVFVSLAALAFVSCADQETTTKETTVSTDTTNASKDTSGNSDYNPATPATQNAPY